MDIDCSLKDLQNASNSCESMQDDQLEKYVKICSSQSIVQKFYLTGKLDPKNQWYMSCKTIIQENQNRVLQKIGLKNKDFDLSQPQPSQQQQNQNKK
ncbi:hypothetical protein ABPG74_020501 [Tetrahymena malaccensis]